MTSGPENSSDKECWNHWNLKNVEIVDIQALVKLIRIKFEFDLFLGLRKLGRNVISGWVLNVKALQPFCRLI